MALKLKTRTQFPAIVAASSPITVTKAGVSYTFALDVTALRTSLDPLYLPTGDLAILDTDFTLQDDGDPTKQAQFQLSGIATATTRTYTLPDADTTLVGTDATQTLSNKSFSTAVTVTSASANSLAIGPNGTTNPALQVDGSAATSATGIKVTTAAAASGVAISAISSGSNEDFGVHAKGSGRVFINTVGTGGVTLAAGGGGVTVSSALTYGGVTLSNAVTGTGNMVLSISPTFTGTLASANLAATGTVTVTSTSASALTVGRQGATDPVLKVNANTASVATGVEITGAAAAGGVDVAAISSGSNENLRINAKGSGTIGIGPTSTGRVTITPVTTITGALTLSSTGLVYDGKTLTGSTGTGNMVLSASPTFTGVPILAAPSATSLTFTSTSGIIGTTTNNSAAAGSVGEYVESVLASGSATALTTNTAKDVTTISLTAGDWDVSAIVYIKSTNASTSFTQSLGYISDGSANTLDTTEGRWSNTIFPATVPGNGIIFKGESIPSYRFSLASTTTIRLGALASFTVSTAAAAGAIHARRVR